MSQYSSPPPNPKNGDTWYHVHSGQLFYFTATSGWLANHAVSLALRVQDHEYALAYIRKLLIAMIMSFLITFVVVSAAYHFVSP